MSDKTETKLTAEEQAKKAKQAERVKRDRAKREALKANKAVVYKFTQDKAFDALPKDVQNAILHICQPTASRGGGVTSLNSMFGELFPKVGTVVTALDVFKAKQWGVPEMRKKIAEALVKAEPAKRLWIDYTEADQTWTLLGTGAKPPKTYSLNIPKAVADTL